MNIKGGLLAVVLATMLSACATTGTKANASSDSYKDLAKSQQWWCGTFGATCACTIDGMKTTCSLVYACLNSGNCKAAM